MQPPLFAGLLQLCRSAASASPTLSGLLQRPGTTISTLTSLRHSHSALLERLFSASAAPQQGDGSSVREHITLNNIADNPGATKKARRVGRGIGSSKGKTAGRGHKGQKARTSGGTKPGFEGGQTPLRLRVPKRGFHNPFTRTYHPLNLDTLKQWVDAGRLDPSSATLTMRELADSGAVRRRLGAGVKLLARGAQDFDAPVHLQVSAASAAAREAVERAGGSVTTVYYNELGLRALLRPEWFEHKGRMLPRPARPPPKLVNAFDQEGAGREEHAEAFVDTDAELVSTAEGLLRRVLSSLRSQAGSGSPPLTAANVASAAVATAEASGALPPLSAQQRSAFLTALGRIATAVLEAEQASGAELAGSEQEADALLESGLAAIKPLLRDVFATVYNSKIHVGSGGRGHTASPRDSVPAGGEQGNISLQSTEQDADRVVAPAETRSDRAERAAEAEFMELELTAFEPHLSVQSESGDSGERGGVAGDAPAAGDGLQVAGDEQGAEQHGERKRGRPPAADF